MRNLSAIMGTLLSLFVSLPTLRRIRHLREIQVSRDRQTDKNVNRQTDISYLPVCTVLQMLNHPSNQDTVADRQI